MEIDDLNLLAQKYVDEQNNKPISDFEWLSPYQMSQLLYKGFGENENVWKFNKDINPESLKDCKFFQDILFLLNVIKKNSPIKLTAKGNLPPKICGLVYDLSPEDYKFPGGKIKTEDNNRYIHILHVVISLLKLISKRKGIMTLSKQGENFINAENSIESFHMLLKGYATLFNWGYNDLYPKFSIIQNSICYTFYLIHKYGDIYRSKTFYGEKLIKAYPWILDETKEGKYNEPKDQIYSCYQARVFERFLVWFGFVETKPKIGFFNHEYIKTDLFDDVFIFL